MLKIGAGNVGFLVLCSNDEVRCTDCHKICKIHGCLGKGSKIKKKKYLEFSK